MVLVNIAKMKLRCNTVEKEFKWIGRSFRTARDRRQENLKHYSAFKYGDIEGKIGDHVLISNFDAVDPESVEGCDVARILKLYELDDAEAPYRAVVQWYSRPQQLPKKFAIHQMPFPQLDNEFEVLEDKRNFDSDVSIETFLSICQVVQAMPEEDPSEVVDVYAVRNVPTFIVRFQFWSQKGKEAIEILPMSLDVCGDAESGCDGGDSAVVKDKGKKTTTAGLKNQSRESEIGKDKDVSGDESYRSSSPEIISTGGKGQKCNDDTSQKVSAKKGRVAQPEKGTSSPRRAKKSSASPTVAGTPKESEVVKRVLRENDITGFLEEESEGEEEDQDDDPPQYTASILSPSRLKLKRVAESPLVTATLPGTPSRKSARSKTSDSPCLESSGTTTARGSSVVHCGAVPTCGARDRVKTPSQSGGVKSKTPKTPSGQDLKKETPQSLKGVSARKRLQLLTEAGLSGGIAERGVDAGPLATPLSPLDEARARLHVSATPRCLPCRDAEFSSIYSFIEDKVLDGVGGCMYVCGVPGTGKTATVRMAVERLQEESRKGRVPGFEFAEINGMRVTEPRRAYSQLLKALTGRAGAVAPEEARDALEQRFSRPAPRRLPTLLLVDELDLLCTRRQDVVYNLMDWPSRANSRLVVITIANTMDLPERVLMSKVCSRMGLTRLTFHPYTFQQLQEIVMSRMEGLKAFDPDAVQLVARKVAAVSGDARRALDICRRATECAESELFDEKKLVNQSPAARRKSAKAMKGVVVTMRHVDQAVSEMISTSKAKAIQSCSEMEKLFLQSVASEVERTGVEEAGFERVHSVFRTLCTYSGFRQPTVSDSMGMCWRLGSLRLLLTEASSRADILQRVMLNVDVDSVHYALKMEKSQ